MQYINIVMSKKIKKLKLKQHSYITKLPKHRNYLVAIVMKKSIRKHKDKKREAKNKGYSDEQQS